jgi:hypothetical protein
MRSASCCAPSPFRRGLRPAPRTSPSRLALRSTRPARRPPAATIERATGSGQRGAEARRARPRRSSPWRPQILRLVGLAQLALPFRDAELVEDHRDSRSSAFSASQRPLRAPRAAAARHRRPPCRAGRRGPLRGFSNAACSPALLLRSSIAHKPGRGGSPTGRLRLGRVLRPGLAGWRAWRLALRHLDDEIGIR